MRDAVTTSFRGAGRTLNARNRADQLPPPKSVGGFFLPCRQFLFSFHPPHTTGNGPAWCGSTCEYAMDCEGMAESTGFMADLCGFSHFTRRVIVIVSAGSCGFVRSVRDAAAKYAQIGRLCAMLGIAAYSLNEMKGRVGAGRTRPADADRSYSPPCSGQAPRPLNPASRFACRR